MLEDSVRTALTRARERAKGSGVIDAALAELGWLELLRAEPSDAVDIVFRALGTADATATALDDVVVSALGETPRSDLAVLLPGFGASDPPGRRTGERVQAAGVATARADGAQEMLVVCRTDGAPCLATVPIAATQVRAVRGIDPDGELRTVSLEADVGTAIPLDPAAWESALALGRRAVAQQTAGACREMLEFARSHALERVQFGNPIARFQAVRTRLADALVAVEALDASLAVASEEPGAETAALAKAVAGRTARTVAKHAQQVLAGIGFTTEHAFHRYLKRTMALEGLFGSADGIVLAFGRHLLATRSVPRLIEL
ncbi:MAG: acyl-CoA dehydrogenase family protein [Candidatus Binatia bacterium]|nr:acyl-CoA dehydrogenase family protein [Candidatus Binatia bacterium]